MSATRRPRSNSTPSTAYEVLTEQDVLGAQIAVTVAHAARASPARELGPEACQRGAAEAREAGELPRRGAGACEARERLLDDAGEAVVVLDRRGGVEAGDRSAPATSSSWPAVPAARRAASVAVSS